MRSVNFIFLWLQIGESCQNMVIPEWELASDFQPLEALKRRRYVNKWVTLDGAEPQLSATWPSAGDVLNGNSIDFEPTKFPLRDPEYFVAHGLRSCADQWEELFSGQEECSEVLDWVKNGVNVETFFKTFKGNYRGKAYDHDEPQQFYQKNSESCRTDPSFVARTLEERITNGSLEIVGHKDDMSSDAFPRCIMPLTLETSKLRLCHDERYLNLFIKDMPFQLDTLTDVPRLVQKGDLLINTDEKSGYDHVSLTNDSRKFFGVAFAGWVLTYSTLPFGFKAACYIYQQIGMALSGFFRSISIPVLQYIDDRLFNMSFGVQEDGFSRRLYTILYFLSKLGYTLSIHKSILVPTNRLIFLGFWIDTAQQCFELPEDKKVSFMEVRELALSRRDIDLLTLQRLAGKCSSMAICIPGALFYTREMNRAISQAEKSSKRVSLIGDLREEIEFWRFLDSWQGKAVWRKETHCQIKMATDASLYKWAGKMLSGLEEGLEIHDYFDDNNNSPIHVKEGLAVLKTLEAWGVRIQNSRLDVFSDNQALIKAWERQGSKSREFNNVLKSLFQLSNKLNLDLQLLYIPTSENPADAPSRSLNRKDAMLSESCWLRVQEEFGPHSCDLMSLDSNVMRDQMGPLKHYTPYPTPNSAGINVFSQAVEREENPYVFPPFCMVAPILSFFKERHLGVCTVVLPVWAVKPFWWPMVELWAKHTLVLGMKGEKGILKYPSKKGWVLDSWGLPCDLVAFRMTFE